MPPTRPPPASEISRLMKPDSRRDAVKHRGGDHGVGTAKSVEEGNQHQTSGGCARQVEKVGAVDALDRFGYGDRNHRPGQKERQRVAIAKPPLGPIAELQSDEKV